MDVLKEAAHYLAICIFFGFALFQSHQISKRSGKSMFLHIIGLGGVEKHMTQREKYQAFIMIGVVLALMAFSTNMKSLASLDPVPEKNLSTAVPANE